LPKLSETPEQWLRVARIVRPQGHRGEVLAELLTDFPDRFRSSPAVLLRAPGAAEPTRPDTVEQFRLHTGRIVLQLAGCTSMNDAETLRGYEVVVPWKQRTPLPEDEVYIAELEGCTLIDDRTALPIGVITDVDRESSNTALLVVETPEGAELLVPFVKAYQPRLDLPARTLRITLPEGLIDAQQTGTAARKAAE
jgi:16S rRNA processing protein RimM